MVNILIVDDSPTQLEQLRFLLEESGSSVICATNGKEGLIAAKIHEFNLVISDIVMPEMDGYELCKALRADPELRLLPVILLTSLTDPRDVIRGLESGANNFICKPYDDRALLARVQNVLANQEIRKTATSEMGINIFFAGQQFFVTADRLQILDLLLSTYENAVNNYGELIRARDELRVANERLEARVAERTVALTIEIEEHRRSEKAREELLHLLRESHEEMENLLYVNSHDLRTPLVNIQGFSDRLGKYLKEIEDLFSQELSTEELCAKASPIILQDVPKALHHINASVQKMNLLINGILKVSRYARNPYAPEMLDLDTLLPEIFSALKHQATQARAEVTIAPLPACWGDPLDISQIFSNLIDNALKYRDPDRSLHIAISGTVVDGAAVYCVEDTGIDIKQEHREQIWGLFNRLDPYSAVPGEGLGLVLVRRIVLRNFGKVWCESEPGVGSRFFVTLPRERIETDPTLVNP